MNVVIVRHLSPDQTEPWEFRLEPLPGGEGVVSVPSTHSGYPIDWPPLLPAQERWLHAHVPKKEACAGAAWRLRPSAWADLLETLQAQVALEA